MVDRNHLTGVVHMPNETQLRRGPVADVAPTLDELTQNVLFGDVWERSGLSKRDRSLITVATLVAMYRTNELPLHMTRAREWRHERGARRADHASHVLRRLAPSEHR